MNQSLFRSAFTGLCTLAGSFVPAFAAETSAPAPIAPQAAVVDPEIRGEERAVLTAPPNVPPPIKRKHATKVIINLEVREVVKDLGDGVQYLFWTFGGDVPGSFIRIRQGDLVEFHLANHPTSKMPHNIDLHAVTGPGGGAAASFTAPGRETQFSFKAINPGLYVYHCATAPVGLHVGNGMYGLILVEPKEGLPPVDREYYVMQGDFYTKGRFGEEGLQPFDQQKAEDERPSYVVFNGAVGSLVGDKALKANVGERVRIFIGNGGPNLTSSFHVIGEIFDDVYQEGGVTPNQHQVQTTTVPAGGSAIVDFTVDVPGTYILVDHALFRAFNKGALGMLKVDGASNAIVFSGKQAERSFVGQQVIAAGDSRNVEELQTRMKEEATKMDPTIVGLSKAIETAKGNPANVGKVDPTIAGLSKAIYIEKGKRVYLQTCVACHQAEGQGLPNVFPPLAKSDFLMADKTRAISTVVKGLIGPITVNGVAFNSVMPPPLLSDEQVAHVLTFVRNSWGNTGDAVTVEEVRAVRASVAKQ